MIKVKGRFVRSVGWLRPAMLPVVTCPAEFVLFTIFAPGFGPTVNKHFEQRGVVIVPHLLPVACFVHQSGEVDSQIIAPAFLKFGEKIGSPPVGSSCSESC